MRRRHRNDRIATRDPRRNAWGARAAARLVCSIFDDSRIGSLICQLHMAGTATCGGYPQSFAQQSVVALGRLRFDARDCFPDA
jgi:hypothetical protein